MVDTVVSRAGGSAALRAVGWQQLVDLLSRGEGADENTDRAYAALAAWRADASNERRSRTCAAVADRAMPARLFEHLATDDLTVAAPVLANGRAADQLLIDLLPRLTGPARALLRHRRTRSGALDRALDAYGPTDRALGGEVDNEVMAHGSAETAARPVAIRTLVDRIDEYRVRRDRSPLRRPLAARDADADVVRFAFETDIAGVIHWTDAPIRGAVIGLSLADGTGEGTSNDVADRFARRLSIRGGHITLPVGSAVEGTWRIEASPVFAQMDGRFIGYVGHARRGPTAAEVGRWALARSNDFRQLVHELRTPLNAIVGFSELIDEQLLGPVPAEVRRDAGDVRRTGLAVLASIDDVDQAARLDAGNDDDATSIEADLTAIVSDYLGAITAHPFAAKLGAERRVSASADALGRMVNRLLGTLGSAAMPGEELALTVTGRKRPRLRVATPRVIADSQGLRTLSLPDADGSDGPLLGLEFTLRLVRRLAERAGGSLTATPAEFTLSLPPAVHGRQEQQL